MRRESLPVGSRRRHRLRRVRPSLSAQGEGRNRNGPSEAPGPSDPRLMPNLSGLAGEGSTAHRTGSQYQRSAPRQVLNVPNTAGSLKGPAKVAQRGARDPALIIRVPATIKRTRFSARVNPQGAAGSTTPRVGQGQPPQRFQAGPRFSAFPVRGKTSRGRSWRDGAPLRPWPEISAEPTWGTIGVAPATAGPARKSRPSTRRRA